MANWDGEVTLIATIPQGQNENGFPLPPTEGSRSVFCDILSIGQNEFYKAAQAGVKVETKVKLYSSDYEGEKLAELNGIRYDVIRTFNPGNGEFVEITLGDLRQSQGAGDG